MIYRGFDIVGGFPIGSPMHVQKDGVTVKEFPFGTSDDTIFNWIDTERRRNGKPIFPKK